MNETLDKNIETAVPLSRFPYYPPTTESLRDGDAIHANNVDGLRRLISSGPDHLSDGETVGFRVSSSGHAMSEYAVTRTGDRIKLQFNIGVVLPESAKDDGEKHDETSASSEDDNQTALFLEGLNINSLFGHGPEEMVSRGDSVSRLFEELGFSGEAGVAPTPLKLKSKLDEPRSKGKDLPSIRILLDGQIDGVKYADVFSDGEFPVSAMLPWYGHDITQEHFVSLVVIGEKRSITLAQLYAKTASEKDTMIVRVFPDQYEINKPDPKKVGRSFSGKDKSDHVAVTLDTYTTELHSQIVSHLDDYDTPDYTSLKEYEEVINEMVSVILEGDHRDELLEYLRDLDPKVIDNGKFSISAYLEALLRKTQQRHGIQPKPKAKELTSDSRYDLGSEAVKLSDL